MQNLLRSERLDHPCLSPGYLPFLLPALARFRGQHDDGHEAAMGHFFDFLDEVDAVHDRHVDVANDYSG